MSRRLYASLIVPALLILLLAACQAVTEPTPVPVTANEVADQVGQQSDLRDTAWAMVSYGVEEQIPALPDTYPSINFMVDRYTGYTGCNFVLGTFSVKGNTILIKWPSTTGGVCESEELLKQETNFLSALTAAEEYEVDGDNLYIYVAGQQVMTMEALEPVPFEGTLWKYRFLQTDGVSVMPIIPGTLITAQFEGDAVSGNAGCNDYTGTVVRDGDRMTISDVAATRKMCGEPENIMEQEQRYLDYLQTTGFISEHPRSFELRNTEAIPLMLFSAD